MRVQACLFSILWAIGIFPGRDAQADVEKFWFGADWGLSHPFAHYKDVFQNNTYESEQFSFRYQWGEWGVAGAYRFERASKSVLDTYNVREDLDLWGAGAAYRISPFAEPETRLGQSHFVLQVMLEYFTANYRSEGSGVTAIDSATGTGARFSANYYFPLSFGIWLHALVACEVRPYKYQSQSVNLDYDHELYSGELGAAYAF